MKKSSAVFLCLSLLMACDPPKTEETAPKTDVLQTKTVETKSVSVETPVESSAPDAEKIAGYYVGMFEAEKSDYRKQPIYMNKINLSIDAITGQQVTGHSVVAGNNRPFTGSLIQNAAGTYDAQVKEPGNNPYDGRFKFVLDPKTQTLTGTGTANDPKLAVSSRIYTLKKTVFKYDPNLKLSSTELHEVYDPKHSEADHKAEAITPDAGKFNASTTALKPQDVENLYKRDLEVMRNAIYARHGYSFQNRQMRLFFDHVVDWYVPVSTDVSKDLTALEKQNIALLKRYENHAAAYYDRFGR